MVGMLVLPSLLLLLVVVVAAAEGVCFEEEVVVCTELLAVVVGSKPPNHETLSPVAVGRCIMLPRTAASSKSTTADVLGHQQGSGTVTVSASSLSWQPAHLLEVPLQ